jgi:hypothetical protein
MHPYGKKTCNTFSKYPQEKLRNKLRVTYTLPTKKLYYQTENEIKIQK